MSKGIDNSYKPLISVCEIIGRIGFRGYTRNDIVEDYKGAISLSPANINNNRLSLNNCTYISWEKYYESPEIMIAQNDIIFCKTGSVGKTAIIHHVAYKMTINPQLTIFRSKEVHPSYLYYVIISNRFQKEVNKLKGTGSVSTISQKDLGNIIIPIPTSIVQEEIVKILDSFTNLIDALNEELSLRQKQFEYYREKLLTFDDKSINVNITPLGEIGNVCMCKRIMRNETNNEGGIPFYKIGTFGGIADSFISKDKFEEYKNKYNYPKLGDILISASGTIGKTVVFDGKPSYYQDSNIVWIDNDETKVINSFLRYIYTVIDWKVDDGGVIKRLYNTNIRSTLITYPKEKAVQQSIVEKLDAFESLISSLKEEIALRQKQYEYYREKLLTFD